MNKTQRITLAFMISVQLSLLSFIVIAEYDYLPKTDEIEYIWIEPQNDKTLEFYTKESLLESLPYLRRINIKSLGFGKVWYWQKGKIVTKNGKELNWKAFTKNIILIETENGPLFYSDIISQTFNSKSKSLSRWVQTSNGPKKIVLEIE